MMNPIHSFLAADRSPTIELVFEKLPSRRTVEQERMFQYDIPDIRRAMLKEPELCSITMKSHKAHSG
jgi:hypothetical protein